MKKILALACGMMAIAAAHAQFEIRPFVGMNFTDVSRTPDGTNSQARLGGQLGGYLMIGNKLHVMPGINLFTQNTEYSATGQNGGNNFDQTINGVQIPLLVGYRFVDADNDPFLNLRLFAGTAMQFLTKTELSDGQANDVVDWNNNSWHAMAGLGLDIKFIFLDLGYSWGLSNTGTPKAGTTAIDSFKSNTFLINVGVRLNFAG